MRSYLSGMSLNSVKKKKKITLFSNPLMFVFAFVFNTQLNLEEMCPSKIIKQALLPTSFHINTGKIVSAYPIGKWVCPQIADREWNKAWVSVLAVTNSFSNVHLSPRFAFHKWWPVGVYSQEILRVGSSWQRQNQTGQRWGLRTPLRWREGKRHRFVAVYRKAGKPTRRTSYGNIINQCYINKK